MTLCYISVACAEGDYVWVEAFSCLSLCTFYFVALSVCVCVHVCLNMHVCVCMLVCVCVCACVEDYWVATL